MCGIGAMWGAAPDKEKTLHEMLSKIEHRGNSLYETLVIGNCALGANRLEITDRSNGRQPKPNEDGSVFAVFNGEIFNHKALKAELESAGHVFQSDCDTETLVHLYEQFGEKMVEKIDSEMFAFAIYDSKTNTLFAARDRWGVKPLYWAKDGAGNHYFASEIKELSCLQQISAIKLFAPGHYFKNGQFFRYCDRLPQAKMHLDENTAAKILAELVDEAVKKRVDTDLPIGVFLSGGLDSTAILATARKSHNDITAIIVGSKNSEDVKFAKRYCEENGVKHIIRSPPTEKEMFESIGQIVEMAESFEPNVVRQSAISYSIAKAAKELNLQIVLCGEGADELFLGYPEFKSLSRRQVREMQNGFLKFLNRTQFQRVDRTSMHFTIEVRVPFFDQKIVEFANSLPVKMKIKEHGGKKIEKYILRKAMSGRLPDYICNRLKVVLSEGAGYKGNQPGGLFDELASMQVSDEEFAATQKEFQEWNLRTKEEAFYFKFFSKLGYHKAKFNMQRVTANHSTTTAGNNPGNHLAEEILHRMAGKKFCRFGIRQPGNMLEIVREAAKKNKPVKFFMLWGIWKKTAIDNAEFEALEIIEGMLGKIREIYPPGARLAIVMADTHAELNMMDKMSVYGYDSYLGSFERYAKSKGHEVIRLSEVLAAKHSEPCRVEETLEEVQNSEFWPILVSSASKYYEGDDKEEGATAYVEKRLAEKPTIERVFKNHIFLTYNGPRYDVLAPDLPTLYPIANWKRTNEKPWFMLSSP